MKGNTMMKKLLKLSREWCYASLTVFLPLAILVLYFGLLYASSHMPVPAGEARKWNAVGSVMLLALPWIGYVAVPLVLNLAFGPSIHAFVYRKRRRGLILVLNLITAGALWMTRDLPWE
jgi:hypothetical protein